MATCKLCHKSSPEISAYLGICAPCIKRGSARALSLITEAHAKAREKIGLPATIPKDKGGVKCGICANECRIPAGGKGYCGLSQNVHGKLLRELGTANLGLISIYKDPHPTNCVAAWCCAGGSGAGYPKYAKRPSAEYGYYNAALFLGTCSYHCLYCQNVSWHEMIKEKRPVMTRDELAAWILNDERITCVCWFGGSPEPQMPFVYAVSKLVREEVGGRIKRMCLESQGNFSWPWLRKIANICLESGGGVKFDLKAPRGSLLNLALSGVKNDASYENFAKLAPWHQKRREVPFLRASTLLVPGYIGPEEIKEIAKFITSVDPSIPYSLLAFAPCYLFGDMPLLKRDVAHECKQVAERAGLERVRIGNLHLLR